MTFSSHLRRMAGGLRPLADVSSTLMTGSLLALPLAAIVGPVAHTPPAPETAPAPIVVGSGDPDDICSVKIPRSVYDQMVEIGVLDWHTKCLEDKWNQSR